MLTLWLCDSLLDWQPKQQNKYHTSPGLCEYDLSVVIIVLTECVHHSEIMHSCVFLDGQGLCGLCVTGTHPTFPYSWSSKLVHIAEDYGAFKASLSFSPELDIFPGSVVFCLCLVQRPCREMQVIRWPPIIAKWHEWHTPGFPFGFLMPVNPRHQRFR